MQKIQCNFHYEIVRAANNKNLFKEGIKKELSEKIKILGVGKKKLNKNEILMFCAVFKFSVESNGYSDFNSSNIKDYYKLQERSWAKWVNVLIDIRNKGMIIIQSTGRDIWNNNSEDRLNPSVFVDNMVYNNILNNKYGKKNEKFLKKSEIKHFDTHTILEKVGNLFNLIFNGEKITCIRLKAELREIISKVKLENSLKELVLASTDVEYVFNLFILSENFINKSSTNLINIAKIFDNTDYNLFLKKLDNNKLELQKRGLVKLDFIRGKNNNYIKYFNIENSRINNILTGKPIEGFNSTVLDDRDLDFIKSEMIYPDHIDTEIKMIKKALNSKNYNKVKKKVENLGYSGGLTFLLYGSSGTGKSRTVYEIAKKTGRKVLEANISYLRGNGLVGDQERETKRLFSEYRRLSKKCKKVPILLINEADSVLSNRIEVTHSSDVGHNNQINIMLDELDKFNGILFATTNLKGNFDSAMDRRFLIKIEFPTPEKNIRAIIWKQKIPELSPIQCNCLADYNISGGVIENIAKKHSLNTAFEMRGLDYNNVKEMVIREVKFRENETRKISGFINSEIA